MDWNLNMFKDEWEEKGIKKTLQEEHCYKKALTTIANDLKENAPFQLAEHYTNHFYYIQTVNNDSFPLCYLNKNIQWVTTLILNI